MLQEVGQHQVDPYAVTVSRRQEGNPVLKHIRNVRWRYGDIVPDYQMGLNACALFLSLRSAPVLNPQLHCLQLKIASSLGDDVLQFGRPVGRYKCHRFYACELLASVRP